MLLKALRNLLPSDRVIVDDLRRLAYGTDASFYRLVPTVIVVVESEEELRGILDACRRAGVPVTFRAAGTSLSGQAITDGVLVLLGDTWRVHELLEGGEKIRLGPAVIGAEANRVLAPLGRKIGPDPASINACKIGGIAANNASGMCCGTSQNSYQTLSAMRLMLADGTVVDTEDPASVAAFRSSHADLLAALGALAARVVGDSTLADRIRHKFRIKNTTGYSINALVDYDDPLDILIHLMIGSEGTLGFISRITLATVVEHRHKASALLLYPDIGSACRAVMRLKSAPVAAVELLDRASLRSVENKPGVPATLKTLGDKAAGLLIEVRGESDEILARDVATVLEALAVESTLEPPRFSTDAGECERLWNIRKGVFPAVGGMRKPGTTVLIEDVAFPIERLAEATLDLEALMHEHGYPEGVIYGHALDGNLHFIFTQDFSDPAEIARYGGLMDAVVDLVVNKYDGSLKAEHGTGRNMAPFVEMEWGRAATAIMRELKALLDPEGLLNPGVVLNDDPTVHLKNLKPMPAADDIVDACIECGFCEPQCPSAALTFSPRQRIVATRDFARRAAAPTEAPLAGAVETYRYMGMDTCAGCGLCSTVCPVGINTGELIRSQRGRDAGATTRFIGRSAARHFSTTATMARLGVAAGRAASAVVGDSALSRMTGGRWKAGLRPGTTPPVCSMGDAGSPRVVYFAGCAGRMMGDSGKPLSAAVIDTCRRAGFEVIQPRELGSLCCGQPFESKGLFDDARNKANELEAALAEASERGRWPIVFDASACALRMREHIAGRLPIVDFPAFAADQLLARLPIRRQKPAIALHLNCSSRRMGDQDKVMACASACAEQVVVPPDVKCCGFGGDRGFAVPELNAHALRSLTPELLKGCEAGYSSNRTCEIGLTDRTGIPYRSLAHLLDECTEDQA